MKTPNLEVRVKDDLTAEQFNCEPAFFDNYIKDVWHEVLIATSNGYIIADPTDDASFYTLAKSWVLVRKIDREAENVTCN
jgi:hypothetical protein